MGANSYIESMGCRIGLLIVLALSVACGPSEREREARHQREEQDRNSAAFKIGEAAHELAKHAEKAAAIAGRKLDEGARKAAEGWKEKEKEDREKARQNH